MSRHLPRRILASAAISVLVAALLLVLSVRIARPLLHSSTLAAIQEAADIDRCVANPDVWGWGRRDLSIYAYSISGQSMNPSAPELEPGLLEQVRTTGSTATSNKGDDVIAVVPSSAAGPCAVLRISSAGILDVIRPQVAGVTVGSLAVGMLLALVGTLGLVTRPLQRRIEALARAARGVGTEGYHRQPGGPDALGYIAEVLSQSHDRVLETQNALEDRNRALKNHLAGIAHDLRTPLASMQLALESVAAEATGALEVEAQRAIADAVYLSSLVENLHEATRLRHEIDPPKGRVDLCQLVRRLEQRFVVIGRHANVEVAASVPDGEVWVACAPARAERALANLVQNAVQHTPGPGHAAMTLTADDHRFELLVTDDGPGLPQETLASLDRETFLTEAARRRGPGLGMLITAEIARRAGWRLSYEQLEPQGLRVRVAGDVL